MRCRYSRNGHRSRGSSSPGTVCCTGRCFYGLISLSNANENLSKAKSSLAQAERACEEMENIAVLCEGIVKKADMFEKLMLNLTELFSQCLVLQNAIIRKKDKKKQRLSRDAFY